MKNEKLFRALGEIDEKYIKSADGIFYTASRREAVSNVFRILGTAASIVLVVAMVAGIWISSILTRDPENPVDSITVTAAAETDVTENTADLPDTETDHTETTDAAVITEPATDTETDPAEKTDAAVTTGPETEPVTAPATDHATESVTEPASTAEPVTEPPETEPPETEPPVILVSSIKITAPETSVETGKSIKLTATVKPDGANNKNVIWSVTSGGAYAKIASDGTFTAVSPGVCTVKAEAADGSGVSASITITVTKKTEIDDRREFKSVQTSHATPENVTGATVIGNESPSHEGGGVNKKSPARVYFKIFDCGYEQFEELLGTLGKYDQISPDTSEFLYKIKHCEVKVWLCNLKGEKIDYVYANKNGVVGFDLYPGEYQVLYEDDGTYKTLYSSIVKVEENEDKWRASYPLYVQVINPLGYAADRLHLHVYNYKWYKPVTVTVVDDMTGEPLPDTYIAFHGQFLNASKLDRYYKTDSEGKLHLDCIFDFIEKWNFTQMDSWHSDVSLYYEKDGYDPLIIKTEKVTETEFVTALHKTEKFEYTMLVINTVTGEPVEGAKLSADTSVSGEFIIETSGPDGIVKGYYLSKDIKDIYGVIGNRHPRPLVTITSGFDGERPGRPQRYVSVWEPDHEGPFILLYTPSDIDTNFNGSLTVAPEGTQLPLEITVRAMLINEQNLRLKVGDTVKLTVTLYPGSAVNKDVIWNIYSGAGYCTLSEDGTFTAIAAGECIIEAVSAGDPSVRSYTQIRITSADGG